MTDPERFDPPRCARGFSLVELLIVVAIIIALTALIVPSVSSIGGGINITAGAEEVAATIAFARQRATSLSRTVSLRFYRADTAGDAPFTSYQVWEQRDMSNATSWTRLDKPRQFAAGLIVSADATFSPILSLSTGTDSAGRYAEFFFTPDGSVAVPKSKACLTLHSETSAKTGGKVSGLPPNFATVNIDPFNGRTNIIRP